MLGTDQATKRKYIHTISIYLNICRTEWYSPDSCFHEHTFSREVVHLLFKVTKYKYPHQSRADVVLHMHWLGASSTRDPDVPISLVDNALFRDDR